MAAFLKSVSIFLMQGRRASRTSETQQRAAAAAVANQGRDVAGADQRDTRRNRGAGGQRAQQSGSGKRVTVVMQPSKKSAAAAKCSSAKLVDSLRRRTHFTRPEIEALLKLHRTLAASARRRPTNRQAQGIIASGGTGEGRRALLDRASFRELLHNSLDLTEEVLMERIFNAFDRRGEGAIDGERWVLGLSVLLRGTPAERRAFCFNVYDLNGDGFVTREEVLQLLAGCLAAPAAADDDPDEGVRDLADMALRKMDADRDGKLSFADFETAVSAEPLLLEAFGNCLPSDRISDSFIATLF